MHPTSAISPTAIFRAPMILNVATNDTISTWMFNNAYVNTTEIPTAIPSSVLFPFSLVRPVCDNSTCGRNGTCINTELRERGYLCLCDEKSVFDGTACIGTSRRIRSGSNRCASFLSAKDFCQTVPSGSSGLLPCSKQYQTCTNTMTNYSCSCQGGSTVNPNSCSSK